MLACRLQIYSFKVHIPATSNASTTNDHSHPSSPTLPDDIPSILRATQWWNRSSTFNIASVVTKIFLPHINIAWTTALYIIVCARTFTPVFFSTFVTTPHCRCTFVIFPYRDAHYLLLNAILRPKYGKAAADSGGSRLTQIVTFLTSKQCCSVSLPCRCSSQSRNFLLYIVGCVRAKVAPDSHISNSGVNVQGVPP